MGQRFFRWAGGTAGALAFVLLPFFAALPTPHAVAQTVPEPGEVCYLDVMFVLDYSNSMEKRVSPEETRLDVAKSSVRSAINRIIDRNKSSDGSVSISAGLVKFNRDVDSSGLTDSESGLQKLKDDLEWTTQSQTHTDRAINRGDQLLDASKHYTNKDDRPNLNQVMILLTDGMINYAGNDDHRRWDDELTVAMDKVHIKGLRKLFTAGYGDQKGRVHDHVIRYHSDEYFDYGDDLRSSLRDAINKAMDSCAVTRFPLSGQIHMLDAQGNDTGEGPVSPVTIKLIQKSGRAGEESVVKSLTATKDWSVNRKIDNQYKVVIEPPAGVYKAGPQKASFGNCSGSNRGRDFLEWYAPKTLPASACQDNIFYVTALQPTPPATVAGTVRVLNPDGSTSPLSADKPAKIQIRHKVAGLWNNDEVVDATDTWSLPFQDSKKTRFDYEVRLLAPAGYAAGSKVADAPNCEASRVTTSSLEWSSPKRLPPAGCGGNVFYVTPLQPNFLQFCVNDGATGEAIAGAHIAPNTDVPNATAPDNLLASTGMTPTDLAGYAANPPYLITGSDGKTNPTFINYNQAAVGTTYTLKGTADGYSDATKTWTRSSTSQTECVNLTKSTQPTIDTVGKTTTPSTLQPGQKNITVHLAFSVKNGKVDNAVVHEKLANGFSYASTLNLKLGSNPVNSYTKQGQNLDVTLGDLNVGSYDLSFDAVYSGGAGDSIQVDVYNQDLKDVSDCGRLADASVSHVAYTVNATTQCVEIDPGSLVVEDTAHLNLNTDALVGNSPIVTGDTLKIGSQSLIVGARDVACDTTGSPSGCIPVANYKTNAGQLSWAKLDTLMQDRITRVKNTGSAKKWNCASGSLVLSGDVYLNSTGATPLDGSATTGNKQVWLIEGSALCKLVLNNTTFHGTGTIINATGGDLEVYGAIAPVDGATLGYITRSGNITLFDQSSLQDVAVFTSKKLTIGQPDSSANPTKKSHFAKLIAQTIQVFRPLRTTISLERTDAVTKNPPPLFEQFYLPQGNEIP